MAFMRESIGNLQWHRVDVPSDTLLRKDAIANPHNRGFVICVHEGNFAAALSLVTELACLGTELPVELHHCTERELPSDLAAVLKHAAFTHVRVVDSCALAAAHGIPRPPLFASPRDAWMKPLALYTSTFDHVMILDAHTLLLRNPNVIWTDAGYEASGSYFFRQRNLVPGANAADRYTHLLRKYTDLYHLDTSIQAVNLELSNNFTQHLGSSFDALQTVDPSLLVVHKTRYGDRLPKLLKRLIGQAPRDPSFAWLTPHDAIFSVFELMHKPFHVATYGANTLNAPRDLELHPTVFCGPVAQRWIAPSVHISKSLFFVHAATLIDTKPIPTNEKLYSYQGYIDVPSHITSLRLPSLFKEVVEYPTCFADVQRHEALPADFFRALARRRAHYHALALGTFHGLTACS
ncbi:hypothetical protein SPRG_19778 [Saprolegnia parasitica CBS 223.65]|uniref:Nucleotide-diphospho-sugar transferase domain-containing protein n=1 Tax=Saprolegnia parasitica (strain CBS 223.65) TaxID=695850 RepID=A0A067CHM8_SAPPC|nr:hypothetical protein SPRG_19778 [Saprolegnia parasitica CBS 223.65]KDO30219.1 hypothetical protein SPRG_19778 [Saprolegnia parasitica CBS 223.65]|eukprot:XP_012199031.1 hypothetical protein SPRG_19778 [Saprolegnia parasitica CBS 223.65]